MKFPNPASRYALVGVFVSKRGSEIRVAVTGAGYNGVFRVTSFEEALKKRFGAEVARGHDHPGRRHGRATSTAAPNIARTSSACWRAGRWRRRGRGDGAHDTFSAGAACACLRMRSISHTPKRRSSTQTCGLGAVLPWCPS